MNTLIALRVFSKASIVNPLLALLATTSIGVAQIPIPMGPDTPPPVTREDFEKAGKFFHDTLKVFTFLADVKSFTSPEPDSLPFELPVSTEDPNKRRTFQFTDENLSTVLRALARQSKTDLVVDPNVKELITVRMENKTPREMIDILCIGTRLKLIEKKGVYYVILHEAINRARAESIAASTKHIFDGYLAQGFTRAEAIDLIIRFPNGFAAEFEEPANGAPKSQKRK